MEVYTPNTGQTKNLITGEERAELRGKRQYIQGPDGKMKGSKSVSGGGSAKGVDKSEKSDTIEKRPKSQKIGKKEKTRLEHQIASDFPNLKPGQSMNYENRNHFYQFTTIDTGKYHFTYKIKLEGNQDVIRKIRKGEL
jgi:hypothetical protein